MSESREQAAEMSTPETLSGVFFEPGRTFEALRARPRFLAATIILALCFLASTIVFFSKVDYDQMIRQAIENSPRADQMSPEQKEQALKIYLNPAVRAINYVSPLFAIAVIYAAGRRSTCWA